MAALESAAPGRPLPDYGLPALPSLPCPEFRGPTPWSNWVIKGRCIAGAYPASLDDAETDHILTTLLELGMNTFVCLQAEFSLHTPESAWRSGQGLRPYIKDAQRLLIRAREDRSPRITQDKLDFLHLPILDGNVTSDTALSRLADDCCQRILLGERLYIHCWGGHGRTGTLVATMLGRLYHLSCSGALRYTQAFHDSRKFPQGVRSPQTTVQVTQVRRLLPDPPHTRGIIYQRDYSILLTGEILRPSSTPPSPAAIKSLTPCPGSAVAALAAAGSSAGDGQRQQADDVLVEAARRVAPGSPRGASPINQQRKDAIRGKAGAAWGAQQQWAAAGSGFSASASPATAEGAVGAIQAAAQGAGSSFERQLGHLQQLLRQQFAQHRQQQGQYQLSQAQQRQPAMPQQPAQVGTARPVFMTSGSSKPSSGAVINLTATAPYGTMEAPQWDPVAGPMEVNVVPAVLPSSAPVTAGGKGAAQQAAVGGRPGGGLGSIVGLLYPRSRA